jgi:hypothetical protein
MHGQLLLNLVMNGGEEEKRNGHASDLTVANEETAPGKAACHHMIRIAQLSCMPCICI